MPPYCYACNSHHTWQEPHAWHWYNTPPYHKPPKENTYDFTAPVPPSNHTIDVGYLEAVVITEGNWQ